MRHSFLTPLFHQKQSFDRDPDPGSVVHRQTLQLTCRVMVVGSNWGDAPIRDGKIFRAGPKACPSRQAEFDTLNL